jgi:hypothetical protein
MTALRRRMLEDLQRRGLAPKTQWQCDPCGQEHYVDHSGHTPSCPKCHHLDTTAWLAERRPELLPVPYLHLVFTVPHSVAGRLPLSAT